ncbi:hypothetical protein GGX14DRAFT_398570 [Mycena pura]|uniref:Uncharacterized protein n=1 Tax=Mycena pura TaxID=153505 RepID=A0AAD6YDE5_9AGAR|nr:hypothetical protein GGX14DRAFT_398570 [Mycena pura]
MAHEASQNIYMHFGQSRYRISKRKVIQTNPDPTDHVTGCSQARSKIEHSGSNGVCTNDRAGGDSILQNNFPVTGSFDMVPPLRENLFVFVGLAAQGDSRDSHLISGQIPTIISDFEVRQ